MLSLLFKRFRPFFVLVLSLAISASVTVCHCSSSFASGPHEYSHATKGKQHCRSDKPSHQESDAKHKHSEHACLCDGNSINGYLSLGEKAPLKTDFLVAILGHFQSGFEISYPSVTSLQSTHSPPLAIQPLYITHLTLLI